MITTTLNRVREHHPCEEGWTNLLRGLGKTKADDEPIAYATILRINGLDDALWCLRSEPQHAHIWRLMAVKFARQVEHLMTDQRSKDALDVAERHARGEATDNELTAARLAARSVAWSAWSAGESAAWSVACSGLAEAARLAARSAAWSVEESAQSEIFLDFVGREEMAIEEAD